VSLRDAVATAISLPSPGGDGAHEPRLKHFPVTFFATVMGLAGLSLAWQRAATVLGTPVAVGETLFWAAAAAGAAVVAAYAVKVARHPVAVRAEARHPVRLAFLPTIGIALVLVAAAGQDIAPRLAEALWWSGAAGQLLLTLFVLSSWVSRPTFAPGQVTPAWFIPVVGLVAVPLAGVRFAPDGLSWFFFASGTLFWVVLLPLVLGRLFVHDQPVPAPLLPTLAVLVAPPAVIMLAYLRLVPGAFDSPVPQAIYDVAVFFALLVVTQAGTLLRLPFTLSWWAYSFPLAALSVATTVMAGQYGGALEPAAWVLLVGVTALITLLAVRTALAMSRRQICVPE
jgi:tellurite resistance protein